MISRPVPRPDRAESMPRSALFAIALIVLALATLGFQAFLHVHVIVDGEEVVVRAGSTVADLLASEVTTSRNGDLLALDGSIARAGGGEPASAWIGGSRAASETVLAGGERVETRKGRDVRERVIEAERATPIPVAVTGTGSTVQMASTGAPGVLRVRVGEVSGQVVASETVRPAVPMKLVRTTPTPAGGARLVALTFDDGPWPLYTDQVLRILREREVKATFFVVGSRVAKQPAQVRRIVADGHVLANHTNSHRKLSGVDKMTVRREMRRNADRLLEFVGRRPRWFRPPGGYMDGTVIEEARRANEKIVLWSVDPQDWRRPGWKKIASHVVRETKPGDVVLLHDGGGNRGQTVEALPRIIDQLREKGYTFVTLDQLEAATKVKAARN